VSDESLPILVAAYGNTMAADDAFGPLVAEAVRAMQLAGVEVIALGMQPASLLDHLAGRRAVRRRCGPL
jgi:hydrogenase maturation protease